MSTCCCRKASCVPAAAILRPCICARPRSCPCCGGHHQRPAPPSGRHGCTGRPRAHQPFLRCVACVAPSRPDFPPQGWWSAAYLTPPAIDDIHPDPKRGTPPSAACPDSPTVRTTFRLNSASYILRPPLLRFSCLLVTPVA